MAFYVFLYLLVTTNCDVALALAKYRRDVLRTLVCITDSPCVNLSILRSHQSLMHIKSCTQTIMLGCLWFAWWKRHQVAPLYLKSKVMEVAYQRFPKTGHSNTVSVMGHQSGDDPKDVFFSYRKGPCPWCKAFAIKRRLDLRVVFLQRERYLQLVDFRTHQSARMAR